MIAWGAFCDSTLVDIPFNTGRDKPGVDLPIYGKPQTWSCRRKYKILNLGLMRAY